MDIKERKQGIRFPFSFKLNGRGKIIKSFKKRLEETGVMRPQSKDVIHIAEPE